GEEAFVVQELPAHLRGAKKCANNKIECEICGIEKKLREMRNHVARHILLCMRGVMETNLIKPVGLNPCGFCGLDGCFTQLLF
ncbi:hypothetical protein B0H14DRAFT_2242564, partial [Mycena olivaceomarginata]